MMAVVTNFWTYVTENSLSLVVGSVVGALIAGGFRMGTGRRAKVTQRHAQEDQEFSELKAMVGEVYKALITEPATPLNPNPTPRLIDTVAEMKDTQAKMQATQVVIDRRLCNVEDTLTKNGGVDNTVLDRLSRIETQVGVDPSTTHADSPYVRHN